MQSLRRWFLALAIAASFALGLARLDAAATLDIYFIDVEGGQSTLIVTPAGESLLVDTGYAGNSGRDANRIAAAAKAAGIKQIDYLLLTHFHGDHAGGVPELAKLLPIRTFVDHDTIVPNDESTTPVFKAYAPVRAGGRHVVPKPGDRLPVKDVDVQVVSSDTHVITKAIDGGGQPNPGCPSAAPEPGEAKENPRSTGIHLRYGRFRFIDLGDLSGAPLFALFCPANLLGKADVYLVPHHGGADVVYPATFAVKPRVAIMNNGEKKGGSRDAFANLRKVSGLEDVWQIHKSLADGAQNYPDDQVANLDETTGNWIKVSASQDGSFSVTNGRTGTTKSYR
jgi:beta-lactamase superfamily II metal-dependent hydrolase